MMIRSVSVVAAWLAIVATVTPRGMPYHQSVSWMDWITQASVLGPPLTTYDWPALAPRLTGPINSSPAGPQTPSDSGGHHGAFPSVTGFGASALSSCNRDTVFVHIVTNTNSSGAGSLDTVRTQFHADTLDIVVFQTGGVASGGRISDSDNNLGSFRLDCVYYAGQSAPGDGFNLESDILWGRIDGGSEDVVVRGLGFIGEPTDVDTSSPQFGIYDVERMVFDRNFMTWCREACIAGGPINSSDRVFDVTFSRVHFFQPNAIEPTLWQNTICGPDECGTGSMAGTLDRITSDKVLMNSGSHRNPVMAGRGDGQDDSGPSELGGVVQFVGHLIYNHNQGTCQCSLFEQFDYQDVYVRTGAMTDEANEWQALHVQADTVTSDGSDSIQSYQRFHLDRIIGFRNRDPAIDSDSLHVRDGGHQEVACYRDPTACGSDYLEVPEVVMGNIYADTAITPPNFPPVRMRPDTEMFDTLVTEGRVGNHMRVDSLGNIQSRLDSLQAAALQEVIDTTGITSSTQVDSAHIEAKNNYLANLDAGVAWRDGDSDGVPDACEERYYGDLDEPPQSDLDGDKWTLVEECWNGSDPTVFTLVSSSGGSTTFASAAQNSYVYRCGMTSQNLITPDGSGGLDTASITSIDMSCYSSLGVLPTQIIVIGDSLAMIVVQSSATGTLMDSADVANRCAIDNECEIDDIRNSDFSEAFLLPKETPKREDPPEPTYASDIWLRVA